jgi:hypothetical protein
MDKLATRLREDAAHIDAQVSMELDRRIRASLHNSSPERPENVPRSSRPLSLWWASSLTGAAVALIVIALLNLDRTGPIFEPVADNAVPQIVIPDLDLNVEAAMLTSPLAEELANLQADLRKAGKAVREDVEIDF